MPRVRAYVAATGGRSKRPGATSLELVEGSPTWFVIFLTFTIHNEKNETSAVHYGR